MTRSFNTGACGDREREWCILECMCLIFKLSLHSKTAVNRGQYAMRPLRRDDFLSVSIHDIYANNQLGTIYFDINNVDIDKGEAM